MWAAAMRSSNGPPGARLSMPNSSIEASTSVIAISMLRLTRNRLIRESGAGSWDLGRADYSRVPAPSPGSLWSILDVPQLPDPRIADPDPYRRSHSQMFQVYPFEAYSGFQLARRLEAAVTFGRKYSGTVGNSSASSSWNASMAALRCAGASVLASWPIK